MIELLTERLRLRALSYQLLGIGLASQDLLAQELGMQILPDLTYPAVNQALQAKLQKMSMAAVDTHPWYTYWLIILKAQPVVIGLLGYKGAPDAAGEVEIGYGTTPAYQRQGYTTEAVRTLVTWALSRPECCTIRAMTLKDNIPSQRVLQKAGLALVGERETELLWRRPSNLNSVS